MNKELTDEEKKTLELLLDMLEGREWDESGPGARYYHPDYAALVRRLAALSAAGRREGE